MRTLIIQRMNWKKGHFWGFGWLTWLVVSGVACSGCTQRTVVPPTTSISPPKQPVLTPPPPDSYSPPSNQPIDPITVNNPWKPDAELRKWDYIVLHHTASDAGTVESIHEEHLKRKDKNGNAWLGIGYHFVIGNGKGMTDGDIEPTFRWRQQLQGAHAGVADYNQHGIGVVLIGNFDRSPPSEAQLVAAKRLVSTLKREYGIATSNVIGHGDVKATQCPGKFFPLDKIRDGVAFLNNRAMSNLAHGIAENGGNRHGLPDLNPNVTMVDDLAESWDSWEQKMAVAQSNLPGDSR